MFTVKIFNNSCDGKGVSDKEGNLDELVVPTETTLFQASQVQFRKHRLKSIEDWERLTDAAINRYNGYSTEGQNIEELFKKSARSLKEYEIEVLQLVLVRDGVQRVMLVVGCSVYVMNEQGVTVDRAHCALK